MFTQILQFTKFGKTYIRKFEIISIIIVENLLIYRIWQIQKYQINNIKMIKNLQILNNFVKIKQKGSNKYSTFQK
jgi:hypothetical protein